jgi:hypothetical protein
MKYDPLTSYLRAKGSAQVRMSFAEIERVIGTKLPPSAGAHRAWWSNNSMNNVMTKAWLAAGYQSEQVDLAGKKLVFSRVATVGPSANASSGADASAKLALFGRLKGTVVIMGDLTEPADPDWGKRLDDDFSSVA